MNDNAGTDTEIILCLPRYRDPAKILVSEKYRIVVDLDPPDAEVISDLNVDAAAEGHREVVRTGLEVYWRSKAERTSSSAAAGGEAVR